VYVQCNIETHSDLSALDSSQMVIQFDPHWVTLLLMLLLFTKLHRLHSAVAVIMFLITINQ